MNVATTALDTLPATLPATLLVVDDVPGNLTVLGELLRDAGYQVKAANSGRAALRYAARQPQPDLILRTQNYVHALATRLRNHPRFAAFLTERTIELLTRSAPLRDIGDAFLSGFDEFQAIAQRYRDGWPLAASDSAREQPMKPETPTSSAVAGCRGRLLRRGFWPECPLGSS